MTAVVLTIIDTAGIQDYIFASNRLRENIGASFLVEQATRDWTYAALPTPHNWDMRARQINPALYIEQDNLAAELIYAGGGNTVILFQSLPLAQTFARDLSRKVLMEAPGIELVIAHSQPFTWSPTANDLKDHIRQLIDGRLAQKKRTRQATPTPVLGLSVTAECASTGLVATRTSVVFETDPAEARLISRDIEAKLKVVEEATTRLRRIIRERDTTGQLTDLRFTDDLDNLGRMAGEESYIAIVHADGNDMSGFIKKIAQESSHNRDYIERMRRFSHQIEQSAEEALVPLQALILG